MKHKIALLALLIALALPGLAFAAEEAEVDIGSETTAAGIATAITNALGNLGDKTILRVFSTGTTPIDIGTDSLSLSVSDSNVTLVWDVKLTGNAASDGLLKIQGGKEFVITESGSLTNTGGASALYSNSSPPRFTVKGTLSAESMDCAIYSANGDVVVSGGTVENTSNTSSGKGIDAGSGSVTVSGGTVSAVAGSAIIAKTVTVSGGNVTSANTTQTIFVTNAGTATVSGGTVENTNTTSSGSAISAIGGSVTVSGGNVSAKIGAAIQADTVTMQSGTVKSDSNNSGAINAQGDVTISGGTVENTNTGTAVTAMGDVLVSGGTVRSKDPVAPTIIASNASAPKTITLTGTTTSTIVENLGGGPLFNAQATVVDKRTSPVTPAPAAQPAPAPVPETRTEDVEGLPMPRELETGGGLVDGKPLDVASLEPGDPLPRPVKDGSLFAGWYTNPDFSGDPVYTVPLGETTFYARWEKLGGAMIIYDASAGEDKVSGKPSKCMRNPDGSTTYILSQRKPKRDGYTFLGWSLNADGSGKRYQPGAEITLSAPTLLHAVWRLA